MITNFYTLQALVREWRPLLIGSALGDAFSQEPDELTLAFTSSEREHMIRIGTRRPYQFMFRSDGYTRARRNVATLFEEAFDRTVERVDIAERDRMIFIDLDGDLVLQIVLFGPRANVLLNRGGTILASFQDAAELIGRTPPEPRAAPSPSDFNAFRERWKGGRKDLARAIASAWPLLDAVLSAEVADRAGMHSADDADPDEGHLKALYDAAEAMLNELESPTPRIYWNGEEPEHFSLIALHHLEGLFEERFDCVDDAARIFVRRSLGRRRYRELYDPVHSALEEAATHYATSAERMLDELARESRADQYERWGHLLMAAAGSVAAGLEEVALEDLFGSGEQVTIPLDPARSAIENAQRYYDRARRTRRSREEAMNRLDETQEKAEAAQRLLDLLESATDLRAVREFRKAHADALAPFLHDDDRSGNRVPFRRFELEGGYQVWVGRNARQNDDLTFHHAQKYDLWMHARGVPGSHAVLRLPNRNAEPGKAVIQKAASIAAYYSKARGSGLVPVMITERKYVRKPKGAPPGAVGVDREDVVLVEPRLPES